MLGKALRPPPDKHHGLSDVETRYRRRELDLIANEESRAAVHRPRADHLRGARATSTATGFIEVETPVLQPLYGGALARPFTTHHNALDRDLYLRIATELYLKRLLVGGLERVYELGKDFRNEGVSHQAQPRVHDGRVLRGLRRLRGARPRAWKRSCARRRGAVGYEGELDFAGPWRRVSFVDGDRARRPGSTCSTHARRRGAGRGDRAPRARRSHDRRQLVADGRRPAVQVRRAEAARSRRSCVDYPIELSPLAREHRAEARAGRALGGVRRRDGDRQRASAS